MRRKLGKYVRESVILSACVVALAGLVLFAVFPEPLGILQGNWINTPVAVVAAAIAIALIPRIWPF